MFYIWCNVNKMIGLMEHWYDAPRIWVFEEDLTPQNYSLVTYVVSQLVKQWIHRSLPIILKFASSYTKENPKTPGVTCKHLMVFWPCIMNWLYINYQLWCTDYYLFIKCHSPLHVSSLKCSSSGGYSCTHSAYGTVTLYESSWWPVGTQLEWELTVGGGGW